MKESAVKMRKGGLDTIVAYIVVIIPLLYVLVYMVATIYHFSVQMFMNQVVKEATVMISTYGDIKKAHEDYIYAELKDVLKLEEPEDLRINYYVKRFNHEDAPGVIAGTVGKIDGPFNWEQISGDANPDNPNRIKKADIIGIQVTSRKVSIMDTITSFSAFGVSEGEEEYQPERLYYTAYREEIIRNERNPQDRN